MAPHTPSSLLQFRLALSLLSLLAAPSLGLLPHFPDGDVVDENNLGEGAPQPLSLPDAVRLYQRLQQEEKLHKEREEGRADQVDARLIGITDGGVYRGDLVVYLPITVLLPTFAFRSRYSLAGRKNSDWSSFRFRSSQSRSSDGEGSNSLDIRGPVDRVLSDQVRYDPSLPDYQAHEVLGPLLSRLDAYFHYLRVHDDSCRMRAICQLAHDPAAYSPLSHLILSALRKSESFARPSTYSPAVFRFFRYYWAAERGVAGEDCGHAYSQCPAGLEDIVNMHVLNFWQNLASYVSIKLSDE